MFYYEQMFNTALSGIMSAGLMSSVLTVAYGILLASLLFSAYEAWTKGGDVRALGVAGVKYLAVGALFMNDGAVYERVFRDVLGAFNQISHTMSGAGPTDVFKGWANDIYVQSPDIDNMPTSVVEAFASGLPVVSTDIAECRNAGSSLVRTVRSDESMRPALVAGIDERRRGDSR